LKITILTINFNNLSGLKKTFESIWEQGSQDFEFVVIDGGSTDGSKEFIESFSKKIAYWVSEPDEGVYHAMNKGLARSTGEYIIHMNSGDTFYSCDTLKEVMPLLDTREDVICGHSLYINDHQGASSYIWKAPQEVTFRYFCQDTLNHQSMFIRKDLFDRVGYYEERYKSSSDWIFLLRSFAYHRASYKPLDVFISKYDRSGLSTVNWKLGATEQQEVLKEEFSFFYNDSAKDIELVLPFWSNLKRNFKRFIKLALPYGIVRLRELRKREQ
jgi:glycosyltransferase involved in cell wall biosynthesis